MKITLKYSKIAGTQQEDWLRANLNDMIWSLDVNLKRRHKASCTGEVKEGECVIDVVGAGRDICEQYIESFRTAMDRNGFKLIVSYA